MRIINGDALVEGRTGNRALLVLAAATGERVAIERSADQTRALIEALAATLPPDEPAPAPAAAKPTRKAKA